MWPQGFSPHSVMLMVGGGGPEEMQVVRCCENVQIVPRASNDYGYHEHSKFIQEHQLPQWNCSAINRSDLQNRDIALSYVLRAAWNPKMTFCRLIFLSRK